MKDLTKSNMYKTFIIFAVPMVLAGLLNQAYNTVDTMIAGKFLGADGLAAIGATSAFIQLISAVFWGYGIGFSIYLARLFGASEYKKIKASIYSNCLAMLAMSAVVIILVLCFHERIFDILNVDHSIRGDAYRYFAVYIGGLFVIVSNLIGTYIMNAFGISMFPFCISVMSAIMNIVGNIFAIAVLKKGVIGLAVVTVAVSGIALVCYIVKIYICFKKMGVLNQRVKPGFSYIKDAFASSTAVMVQQIVMCLSSACISPFVNGIGSAATAAYTVILKIYDLNASMYQNSSKVLSNYAAQCMGAREYKNVAKAVRTALLQGIVFTAPTLIICIFYAPSVAALFFPKEDMGTAFNYAVDFCRMCLPFILLNLINNLFHAFFRGVSALKFLVVCTAFGSFVRMAVSILTIMKFGIYGMFIGWIVSWLAEGIMEYVMYRSKKWQPHEMKEWLDAQH